MEGKGEVTVPTRRHLGFRLFPPTVILTADLTAYILQESPVSIFVYANDKCFARKSESALQHYVKPGCGGTRPPRRLIKKKKKKNVSVKATLFRLLEMTLR